VIFGCAAVGKCRAELHNPFPREFSVFEMAWHTPHTRGLQFSSCAAPTALINFTVIFTSDISYIAAQLHPETSITRSRQTSEEPKPQRRLLHEAHFTATVPAAH